MVHQHLPGCLHKIRQCGDILLQLLPVIHGVSHQIDTALEQNQPTIKCLMIFFSFNRKRTRQHLIWWPQDKSIACQTILNEVDLHHLDYCPIKSQVLNVSGSSSNNNTRSMIIEQAKTILSSVGGLPTTYCVQEGISVCMFFSAIA